VAKQSIEERFPFLVPVQAAITSLDKASEMVREMKPGLVRTKCGSVLHDIKVMLEGIHKVCVFADRYENAADRTLARLLSIGGGRGR